MQKGSTKATGESGVDEAHDPFDPKRLRISQRFGEGQEVHRILLTVPVRKPHRQEFIRTHPDPEMWFAAAVLELKADRQHYLVTPELQAHLPGEAVPKILVPTLTSHGLLMLWPIRLPDEQGRLDEWNSVALQAAERAREKWLRLTANMSAGCYDVVEALGVFPEPLWPEIGLQKLLELGFRDRVIDGLDHPVLRRLRGEI